MGNYSKFHLQVACNAFHQEDYETAILNFRAVLEVGNFYEAIIGLAVAYFMVKDYKNTSIFIERYKTRYPEDIIESLKNDISTLATNIATIKEEAIAETTVNEIQTHSTNGYISQTAIS